MNDIFHWPGVKTNVYIITRPGIQFVGEVARNSADELLISTEDGRLVHIRKLQVTAWWEL